MGVPKFIFIFWLFHYTKPCLLIALRNFSAVFQRKLRIFFRELRFFGLQAEVLTFKLEFSEKFAGLTEAALFFTLSLIFVPGAEHSCAAGIGRTVFADAGFKVMVRTTYPEISPILFSGLRHNIGYFLPGLSASSDISFVFRCELEIQSIPLVHKKA